MNVTVDLKDTFKQFEQYLKDISDDYYAKVGVLGAKKNKGGASVVDYGLAHEFGSLSDNLPKRSFIKEPLEKHLAEEIKSCRVAIRDSLESKNLKKATAILGLKGVEIIKKAFETSNDGEWAELSQSTIDHMSDRRKKGWKILIDEGTLVSSIQSKVVKNDKTS